MHSPFLYYIVDFSDFSAVSVFQFQLLILCYFSGWTPVAGTILESPFKSFQVLDEAIELRGKIKVDWSNTAGWKGHRQFSRLKMSQVSTRQAYSMKLSWISKA